MSWQMVVLFPIICILRFWYICIVKCDRKATRYFKPGPNVLVLTAHPDDECMFFAPLILKLTAKKYKVHLLCCSSGDYYNQGELRKKELLKSCELLGIPESRVRLLQDARIQDDPKVQWDVKLLCSLLQSYIDDHAITNVITFDEMGVSGHENHKSLYQVAKLASLNQKGTNFFKLITTNIFRKYIFILDMLPTFMSGQSVYVSSWAAVLQAQKAMKAHWSQFKWFRILYIGFSRYMMMNDIEVIGREKDD